MTRAARWPLLAAGTLYALFGLSCVRLAVVYSWDRALSVGEAAFTFLGATALFIAAAAPRGREAIVIAGTLPLVVWFLLTPWNSGPPFLVASAVAPTVAGATLVVRASASKLRP